MKILDGHFKLLWIIIAVLALSVSCRQDEIVHRHVLFETSSADSVPYRIPALAVMSDGSMLALADYRHCRADIGWGRVDIHARRSCDGGKTWGEEFTLISGTGIPGSADCGFGDAAIVADREQSKVLVMMVCGNTVYWHETTNRSNPNRIAVLRSHDNGNTWDKWEDVTEQIYGLFDDSIHGCVESCFVGSGKICQSRRIKVGSHYRIYAALCARPNGNRVIYSDDFGRSWAVLGTVDDLPAVSGDEPKCAELSNGNVLLSSRTRGGRIFNVYQYTDVARGTGSWGNAAFSGEENNGCAALENSCNGEILILPLKRNGKIVDVALQSVPLGPGRTNVGVYYKELSEHSDPFAIASDWCGPYQISASPSAYSTMSVLPDGNLGFLYEECEGTCPDGYNIVYSKLPKNAFSKAKCK